MRFLTPEFNAILDYLLPILLVISPFTLGFYNAGPESMVPITLGLIALFITPFTDFKFAIVRAIPLKLHLILDFAMGVFLIASPWLFDFYRLVSAPHVIFGLILVITSMLTRTSRKDEAEEMNTIT